MGLYLRHPASFGHDTGAHPENARRIVAIEEALEAVSWLGLEVVEAPRAELEQVTRVHPEEHVRRIERLSDSGGGMIDMDTVASPGSFEAALRAAGGAVHAVDRLMAEGGFAFCGMRPPGHHCSAGSPMGFCLLNNVAVASTHALEAHAVERVLIFDWDVHHGNGTEDIFIESDRVLFASVHQSPLYPGTGGVETVGSGAGEGYTVNLPVPPGSGFAEFASVAEHVVIRLIESWRPGFVCISAGYDAHRADPLADCELTEADYGRLAGAIGAAAHQAGAPVLVCLEGGYAVDALAGSVVSTLGALADPGAQPELDAPVGPAAPHRARLQRWWPALG